MRASPTSSDVLAWVVAVAFATAALAAPAAGSDDEAPAAAEAAVETAPELERRRFVLTNRTVDEAYALVAPYLSEQAEILVDRRSSGIEISDEAAVLEQVAKLLEELDVPPRYVRFSIWLVKGEKRERAVAQVDSDVPPNIRDLVRPNTFETLGEVDLTVREGQVRHTLLGDGFRVEIELGSVDIRAEVVELERFSLERQRTGASGGQIYRPVLQFGEELAIGQRRILFATPGARDPRALFLILQTRLDES